MFNKGNPIFLIICLLASSAPFFFVPAFFGDDMYYVFVNGLTVLVITNMLSNNLKVSNNLMLLFGVILLSFVIIGLVHAANGSESEVTRLIIGLSVKFIIVIALSNGTRVDNDKFGKLYINLGYYLSIMTIILGMLLAIRLWPLGYSVSIHEGNRVLHNFYISFASSIRVMDGPFARLSSYLDEPGAYAFFVSMGLIMTHFVKTHKIQRHVLLIGGLFSYSLAYYIFVPFYLLYLIRLKINATGAMLFILSVVGVYLLYSNIHYFTEMVDKVLLRLEYKDDKFVGDNRFYGAEYPKNILFGDGLVGGRDSIIAEIRNIGLIGVSVLYSPIILLFLILLKRKDSRVYLILLIFALLMQRPVITKLYIYLPIFWIMFSLQNPKHLIRRR